MAAGDPNVPVKQLRELLQEQQEPFILELYLVERGYLRKSSNAGSSFPSCHGNSSKRSFSFGLRRSKKGLPQFPKVLKSAYNQVISFNGRLRIKTSNDRGGDVDVTENQDKNDQTAAELDGFSSASISTVFNSCCGSDVEEASTSQQKEDVSFTRNTSQAFKLCNLIQKEVATDRKLQWQYIKENKQPRPMSVLEEVASQRDKTYFRNLEEKNTSKTCALSPKRVTEDSILSASFWKILFHSADEKPTIPGVSEIQELVQSNLSTHHLKSKSNLQQTKQLLFDCVREIVENHGRKKKDKQQQSQYLTSQELGKLNGEKIKLLGKKPGEESTLRELLELEFLDSAQEWSGYEPQRRDIGFQIGDYILDEISNEIVEDMIDLLLPITRC